MLLDVDTVIPYLIQHGLLDAGAVIDGDVQVVSASRRNRNFRVARTSGPSYLLKQAESEGHHETLTNEAAFYRLCFEQEGALPVRALLPRFIGAEIDDALLIIELLQNVVPLQEAWPSFKKKGFLAALGRALGAALGTCHRVFVEEKNRPGRYNRHEPWVLWVHKPGPEILAELSAANRKVLEILQNDVALCRLLDSLRKGWRADTLIHGDIKADNLLVGNAWTEDSAELGLRLVDWELCQLGDPAWDVGAVFKDLLLAWIWSMPITAGAAGRNMVAEARYPLPLFQSAWQHMWRSYRAATGLAAREAEALLGRAVRYAAAGLVQSAYEIAFRGPALSNHEVMMLQVSANILRDADAATLQLFGIPQRYTIR